MSILRRLAKKCDIECPLHKTKEDILHERKHAWDAYAELKPCARQLHDSWLDRLADIIADEEGEDRAQVIRQLKTTDDMKAFHRSVSLARKKQSCCGTQQLLMLDPHDPIKIFSPMTKNKWNIFL